MASNRRAMIDENVKRELSMIVRELKDPRINMMTSIISVQVAKDMAHAKVFVSVMGDEAELANTIKGLKSAEGFIKRELSSRLDIRNMPALTFVPDTSIAYGAHINKVLNEIAPKQEDKGDA